MDGVWRDIGLSVIPRNWMQCMENSLDPVHTEWLHGRYYNYVMSRKTSRDEGGERMVSRVITHHLKIGFDLFEHGIIKRRVRDGGSESEGDTWVNAAAVMPELPGRALAHELLETSRDESRRTPMEAVIQTAREDGIDRDRAFRLIGRLWTLERMFYYVYGGWGQGLEVNDFPPSVKYLFSRQIVDESTHEMVYLDVLLRKGWVPTQKDAFRNPYGRFEVDSALAYFVFSLRNLATYPHTIRIAALNLGPKILELGWMEALAEALTDPELKGVFTSQVVENRSHINMGRRIVEEFVAKPVETELCRWACAMAKADYRRFLHELSDFVLGRQTPGEAPVTRVPVTD
jgi:hypothetical protein